MKNIIFSIIMVLAVAWFAQSLQPMHIPGLILFGIVLYLVMKEWPTK